MPIAAIHPLPMADAPIQQQEQQQQQQQQQPRLPLRRAVYVHVSDLVAPYNIDHRKLEQELARVKNRNDENASPERDLELAPGDDMSVTSVPQQKPRSLHPPRAGFNLCVLVGQVKVVVDKFRVDRSRVRLAEVEVGDETGVVSLRARDEQIEALQEVSDCSGAVVLRNCSLELFQGKHIRIAVTKWGKLTPYPDQVASTPPQPSKINRDRNFSSINLSLVASELMEISASESAFSPQSQYRALDNAGVPNQQPARHQSSRQQQFQHMQQGWHERKAPARDRRQHRPKQAGMGHSHGMLYPESTGIPGQMSAMQQYSGMRRVSHFQPQSGRPHSHQASTQHLLMQQYEMHQRQLQQMQAFHGQQERNRSMMHGHHLGHQMQAPMLVPNLGGSPSFDDFSVSSAVSGHQSMHLVGNNPILIRLSVPGVQQSMGAQPDHFSHTQFSHQQPEALSPTHDSLGRASHGGDSMVHGEAWGTAASYFVSTDDSSLSPGQMNPQATAFAPAYAKDPQGEQQQMQSSAFGYVAYDPTGTLYSPSQAQHPVYSQNVVYVPVSAGATGAMGTERSPEDRDVAASPSDSHRDPSIDHSPSPEDTPPKP